MTGYARLCQLKLGLVISSGYVRLDQVKSGYVRICKLILVLLG